MTTHDVRELRTSVDWGGLRSALEGNCAGDIAQALRDVESKTGEVKDEVRSYLMGKLRERPQLIDQWPMHVLTRNWIWIPLEDSLGHFTSPQAPFQMIAGNCRASSTAGALLPLEATMVGQVKLLQHGWDEFIWEEVAHALRLCALEFRRHSKGATPEIDEASWRVFEAQSVEFYAKTRQVIVGSVGSAGSAPATVQVALNGVARDGLQCACDHSVKYLHNAALGEGASSLVALAGVYLRIRSYTHDRGITVPLATVQKWWDDACRRLFKIALEMGEIEPVERLGSDKVEGERVVNENENENFGGER